MRGFIATSLAILLAGCVGSTTNVSTKSAAPNPDEVFWAKNQLAEQSVDPAAARFSNFQVLALSNGDRVYCGDMSVLAASGLRLQPVPFYLRRSGGAVKALNWTSESAAFSAQKCAEARSGTLRINTL